MGVPETHHLQRGDNNTAYTEGFKAGMAWEMKHQREMRPIELSARPGSLANIAFDSGCVYERQRIIKLLESELSQEMSESAGYIMTENNYPVRWPDLIALIKGEK